MRSAGSTPLAAGIASTKRLARARVCLAEREPPWCMPMRKTRYLFIIKAILKDSKVVVCWIAKAFARTSASSS
ncbi:hypothetical protein C0Z17_25610 [Trinickia caryophylli]|nr:hypothetical protein C0Z17_25610 [Trinickia caryophylli]